jgi:nucleoside-diphosphate-sugar epimerase
MTILITGCSGALGEKLVEIYSNSNINTLGTRNRSNCSQQGKFHNCLNINLLKEDNFSFIDKYKPKVLVHTSWITKPDKFWNSKENVSWKDTSIKLFDKFLSSNGEKIISIGSCAEYKWENNFLIKESNPINFSSSYSINKLKVLEWLQGNQINFLWPRVFFQFGGKEKFGRVVPKVIF